LAAAEIVGSVAIAAVAAGGTLAWAALSPESQLFGRTLVAPARPDEIALTYDDGPNPAVTAELLDVLAKHEVRATFFMIGGFVRQCPSLVREVAAAGHLVGNHTMTHPWLAWQTERRIREELYGASSTIEDILGQPVRYFRAPHGARRPVVLRMAREMGMTPVQWNVICSDWKQVGVEGILGYAVRGVERSQRRGFAANVVLHDGGHLGLGAQRMDTVGATKRFIQRYASKKFVAVDAW
jgi:peptidoglycan/xylan/chitin deacetylase (PgdA/CDA1 family)